MTPEQNLEHYLCHRIRQVNFDASRTQVVPANDLSESTLTLPRVVVECASGEDPVMAQAGVYPVAVTATIFCNAREPSDLYLLDPLREAVTTALQFPGVISETTNPAARYSVAIYGATLGATTNTQADDRIEVQVSATIHARLI